jgi:hypothetical protein
MAEMPALSLPSPLALYPAAPLRLALSLSREADLSGGSLPLPKPSDSHVDKLAARAYSTSPFLNSLQGRPEFLKS